MCIQVDFSHHNLYFTSLWGIMKHSWIMTLLLSWAVRIMNEVLLCLGTLKQFILRPALGLYRLAWAWEHKVDSRENISKICVFISPNHSPSYRYQLVNRPGDIKRPFLVPLHQKKKWRTKKKKRWSNQPITVNHCIPNSSVLVGNPSKTYSATVSSLLLFPFFFSHILVFFAFYFPPLLHSRNLRFVNTIFDNRSLHQCFPIMNSHWIFQTTQNGIIPTYPHLFLITYDGRPKGSDRALTRLDRFDFLDKVTAIENGIVQALPTVWGHRVGCISGEGDFAPRGMPVPALSGPIREMVPPGFAFIIYTVYKASKRFREGLGPSLDIGYDVLAAFEVHWFRLFPAGNEHEIPIGHVGFVICIMNWSQ